jgi:hypothetical protein
MVEEERTFDVDGRFILPDLSVCVPAGADTWLGIALADPDNHSLAVTAGRLMERERAAVVASRRSIHVDGPTRRRIG